MVTKGGAVEERILLDKHPYYMAGKNKEVVDIPVVHGSVSRVHCVFVHHRGGSVYVIDLASNNGVFVNDKRIPSKTTTKITELDTVKIGASSRQYSLRRTPPPASEARPIPSVGEKRKNEETGSDPKRTKTEAGASNDKSEQPARVTAFQILLKHAKCRNAKSFRDSTKDVVTTEAEAIERLNATREKLMKVCG